MLAQESLLHTLAEISVAFVGFSMLASVLRGQTGRVQSRFAGFRDVAELGLIATFGSITPLMLDAFSLAPEAVWRYASAAFGVAWAIGASFAYRRRRSAVMADGLPGIVASKMAGTFIALNVIAIACLVMWNVLSSSTYAGAIHVLAIGLVLLTAAIIFLLAGFGSFVSPET